MVLKSFHGANIERVIENLWGVLSLQQIVSSAEEICW